MNVQFVRLSDDVCEKLNDLARGSRKTVSSVVNEILREYLQGVQHNSAEKAAG